MKATTLLPHTGEIIRGKREIKETAPAAAEGKSPRLRPETVFGKIQLFLDFFEGERHKSSGLSIAQAAIFMVEVTGFEPATFWSRTKRATKLRYTSKWSQ